VSIKSTESKEEMRIDTMPKTTSSKVTIDVPADLYKLLTKIKGETGKSIRSLVSEGLPLVILKYEDVLEESKKEALIEAEMMDKTLNRLKESIKK